MTYGEKKKRLENQVEVTRALLNNKIKALYDEPLDGYGNLHRERLADVYEVGGVLKEYNNRLAMFELLMSVGNTDSNTEIEGVIDFDIA